MCLSLSLTVLCALTSTDCDRMICSTLLFVLASSCFDLVCRTTSLDVPMICYRSLLDLFYLVLFCYQLQATLCSPLFIAPSCLLARSSNSVFSDFAIRSLHSTPMFTLVFTQLSTALSLLGLLPLMLLLALSRTHVLTASRFLMLLLLLRRFFDSFC